MPIDQNLPPFVRSLVASRNPDFTVTAMPDQDHFFLTHQRRRFEKHKFGQMEVSPDLLKVKTDWLQSRVT